ncbi:hypothetical protein Acr_15g0018770 [Actinidia rufa]|uniref:Aminotransferase-like plant mobile domain-containing protein n=1 Tax=Actinidia rufa TaxID=165716 RepID=A0A7J0FX48_9ERIC|nr:hypothetical protein Acr_15g0018770 [Actinidia rufa]
MRKKGSAKSNGTAHWLQFLLNLSTRVDIVRTNETSSACTRGALEDMHNVITGPDDMAVLYLQDQHRSEDIWSGQVTEPGDDLVKVRQPHLVYDLDERVHPFVIAFGFYEISRIHGINLDHGLISVLLEQWRCETHTFHLRVEEMTPTLQDVAMLTGLPIDGAPVTGLGKVFDPNELCLRLLGRVPPRTAFRGDNLKLTWMESEFQTPPDEATEDQLIMYARAYIMYLFGGVIFTSSAGVDEMGRAMANNTLDFCCRGRQEVGEVEHLDATLIEDETAFREWGQVFRDAGLSTSVPNTSMSWDDGSAPGPSLSWGGGDPSMTAPSHSTRWGDW